MFTASGFLADDDDENSRDVSEIGSPSYSDRVSSDCEESLYQEIHHAENLSRGKCEGLETNSRSKAPCVPTKDESKCTGSSSGISLIKSKMTVPPTKPKFDDPQVSPYTRGSPLRRLSPSKVVSRTLDVSVNNEVAVNSVNGLPNKFSSVQTSTPYASCSKDHLCSSANTTFETVDSCDSDSADEIIFMGINDKINLKRKRQCTSNHNTRSSTSQDIQRHRRGPRENAQPPNIDSDDSSNDVICIDSVSSSDDLLTNVGNKNEGSFKFGFNASDTQDLSGNSSMSSEMFSAVNVASEDSDSSLEPPNSEAWHVDMVDKMRKIDKRRRKRYFANTCRICHANGHNERHCSLSAPRKCFLCGDNHLSSVCCRKVCGLCFSLGHDRHHCSYPSDSVKCNLCKVNGHTADRCPDIWRRYHLTTTSDVITKAPTNLEEVTGPIYCYNCGEHGHYGHQCRKPRLCRGSKPSLPYVLSYKNPAKLMRTRSFCHTNARMEKIASRISKLHKTKLVKNEGTSNPSTSGMLVTKFRKNGNWKQKRIEISKLDKARERKSFFSNKSSFQRTPKSSPSASDLQLPSKKKRKKKKMRASGQPVAQQIS